MELYITPKKIIEMTFENNIPEIPETVYIIFQKSLFKRLEKNFKFEKVKSTRGDFYIEKNKKFGVVTNIGIGESTCSMLAEELSFLGVKKVIAFGMVGGLNDKFRIGDIVIVEKSLSQSNIADIYEYTGDEILTSSKQNDEIVKKITDSNKIDFVKCISVPTIYRETTKEIEKARQKGVDIIDMEVFSLSLVFFLRDVDFSAIGCISDILDKEGWSFESDFKNVFDNLEKSFMNLVK